MSHRGYKRPQNLADLGRLVDELQAAAPWLDLGANESACRRHHDATDAALTARTAFRGLATTPDKEHVDTATAEGWIALPTTPLHDLRP